MSIPLITPLPPAPNRRQSRTDYPATADAWAAALGPYTGQLNDFAKALNPLIPTLEAAGASADAAAKSAKAAQDAQAAAEAAAGNPIRLGLLHAVALCF
ncbi:hypothetical protein V6W80_11580 [Pseudomonas benzopyrenica]|uniref:Uncharacterized protein n=1 Tax=Pseudomonas benzopyrenica TaxID=2993566 RepID=A0ABZ2FVK3_9PSED